MRFTVRVTIVFSMLLVAFQPGAMPQQAKQEKKASAPLKTNAELIASAMSAAPASVSRDATIIAMENGKMRTLREGKSEFTCMPDDPGSPGNDPTCADRNAMEWLHALIDHKQPPKGKAGLFYMLQGGSDASNDDPYATTPPAGKKWVTTGPHVMVVGATEMLGNYPKNANDTSTPYIMFPGTPYQHVMMPVK